MEAKKEKERETSRFHQKRRDTTERERKDGDPKGREGEMGGEKAGWNATHNLTHSNCLPACTVYLQEAHLTIVLPAKTLPSSLFSLIPIQESGAQSTVNA